MSVGIIPETWMGHIHALLRVVTGLLFLEHGSVQLVSFNGLTAELELVGGILIIIGLFTRVTAFVLAGMMAVAYFMAHAPQSFFPIVNMGDLAILFCFVFLYLASAGAGPYSIDSNYK